MARRRKPGFPNVVRIRLRQCGNASCSAAADEMPSPPGISMSSNATSGRLAIAARTTSSARAASATTCMSSSMASSARSAPRTIAWSSAIRTRITVRPSRRQRRPAGGFGPEQWRLIETPRWAARKRQAFRLRRIGVPRDLEVRYPQAPEARANRRSLKF